MQRLNDQTRHRFGARSALWTFLLFMVASSGCRTPATNNPPEPGPAGAADSADESTSICCDSSAETAAGPHSACVVLDGTPDAFNACMAEGKAAIACPGAQCDRDSCTCESDTPMPKKTAGFLRCCTSSEQDGANSSCSWSFAVDLMSGDTICKSNRGEANGWCPMHMAKMDERGALVSCRDQPVAEPTERTLLEAGNERKQDRLRDGVYCCEANPSGRNYVGCEYGLVATQPRIFDDCSRAYSGVCGELECVSAGNAPSLASCACLDPASNDSGPPPLPVEPR